MPEEEINTDELTLNQKVEILMGELPRPVQDFLRSPERDQVSLELSAKYNLHTDQAGVFSRAYIYMLLGVYTPEEFVQELRDAGIAEATVQGLTQDVNERVFKRLQNAERNSTASAPAPASPPQPQAMPAPQPAPAPMPVPPTPAPFAPVPQAMPASAPIYVSPEAAQPAIRTMAHDMQVLKEEEKHPHQATPIAQAHEPVPAPTVAPQPISWQPSSPARSFQTSSVPNTLAAPSVHPAPTGSSQGQGTPAPQAPMPVFHAQAPQPAAIPPAHPPIPAPEVPVPHNLPTQPAAYPWQSQQASAAPTAPSPTQRPQMPIIKEYSVDPYRETPE